MFLSCVVRFDHICCDFVVFLCFVAQLCGVGGFSGEFRVVLPDFSSKSKNTWIVEISAGFTSSP